MKKRKRKKEARMMNVIITATSHVSPSSSVSISTPPPRHPSDSSTASPHSLYPSPGCARNPAIRSYSASASRARARRGAGRLRWSIPRKSEYCALVRCWGLEGLAPRCWDLCLCLWLWTGGGRGLLVIADRGNQTVQVPWVISLARSACVWVYSAARVALGWYSRLLRCHSHCPHHRRYRGPSHHPPPSSSYLRLSEQRPPSW